MCLVVFAWQSHPDYGLVLAANRDEFHERPTEALHWWPDRPGVLAGRDLQAGGTWLAVGRSGRFATVTNYREQQQPRRRARSRGELVTGFVGSDLSPADYLGAIDGEAYAGFSLLCGDARSLACSSNRGDDVRRLEPGVYGLSNAALDTPWPKLVRTKTGLARIIDSHTIGESQLLQLMADRQPARVAEIHRDGLSFDFARAVSAPFICTPEYGTRCTSVLLFGNNGKISLSETRFDARGAKSGQSRFSFAAN